MSQDAELKEYRLKRTGNTDIRFTGRSHVVNRYFETVRISGRVIDKDGKGLGSAKVVLIASKLKPRFSDKEGNFRFRVPKSQKKHRLLLVASCGTRCWFDFLVLTKNTARVRLNPIFLPDTGYGTCQSVATSAPYYQA